MDWFVWNPYQILVYSIISIGFYAITFHEDLRGKIKYPKLIGLAVSLMSWFELGLFCTLTVGLYIMFAMVIDSWVEYFQNKKPRIIQ